MIKRLQSEITTLRDILKIRKKRGQITDVESQLLHLKVLHTYFNFY